MSANVQAGSENGINRITVSGELRLDTVSSVYRNVNLLPGGIQSIEIGLSGVTQADSAGVALCVEWISQARKKGVPITFTDVPEVLMRIARVNKLEELINSESP